MALDIRLDFISKIHPLMVTEMARMRELFIEMDEQLQYISDALKQDNSPAGLRTIALARTNLEMACQYTIKSLCILGEQK